MALGNERFESGIAPLQQQPRWRWRRPPVGQRLPDGLLVSAAGAQAHAAAGSAASLIGRFSSAAAAASAMSAYHIQA